jgi:DNA-binding transcriptional regulator YdaS (Cro superfamily)
VQKFQKLVDYLERAGLSQREFGAKLVPPVTQSAVAQWVQGEPVKAERVLEAAAATEWNVTPNDWRPDLYPHPDDGLPREGSQLALRLSAST